MINQVFKDIRRKISTNKSYFWILIITITIGITLFSGSSMLGKTIDQALKSHYDKMNIMDIKVNTNLNFDSNDKNNIKNIPGIKGVMMSKSLDAIAKVNNDEIKVKLSSLPNNMSKNNPDYINRVTLLKGKLPTTINEAVIEESFYKSGNITLNDLVTLTTDNDSDLRAKKIKIVGIIKESYHDLENNNNTTIYLNENEFNSNYYDDIYITANDESYINKIEKEIKNIYLNIKEKQISEKSLDKQIAEESLNNIYSSSLPQDELGKEITELTNNLNRTKQQLSDTEKDQIQITKKEDIKTFELYKSSITKTGNIIKSFSLIYLILIIILSIMLQARLLKKDKKEIEMLKKLGYNDSYIFIKYISFVFIIDIIAIFFSLIMTKVYVMLIGLLYKSYYGINITKVITNNSLLLIIVAVVIISLIITFIAYKTKKINIKNSFISKIINLDYAKVFTYLIIILGVNFIFTGYQISSKIASIPKQEFKNIIKYDLEVEKHSNQNINIKNNVLDKTSISKINITINEKLNSNLMIIKNNKEINKFINIKGNVKKQNVIITSNVANTLNVSVNDKIKINLNEKSYELKVTDITKDYINNYVYISPTLYKTLTDQDINYDTILIKVKNKNKIIDLQNELINSNKIKNVITINQLKESYENALTPMIISILMISAIGNIILLLMLYILIIKMVNEKNLKLKRLGYYNEEIIKMHYGKYKIGLLLSLIVGVIASYITSTILINYLFSNSFGLKNGFSLLPYIFLLINIIFVCLICKHLMDKYLKVNKM